MPSQWHVQARHSITMRIGAAILLFLLAAWSGVWAFAEVLTIPPRSLMDKAVKQKDFPADHDWLPMLRAMDLAASLKPLDADIQLELGRMWAWQAARYPAEQAQHQVDLTRAMEHLKRAIELRPTWGLAWAQLAYAQIQARDLSQTGAPHSLKQAIHLTPYDDYVQRLVLWSGFAMWDILPTDTHADLLRISEHAIANLRHRWVADYAVQFYREKHLKHLMIEGTPFARRLRNQAIARDRRRQPKGL